jgi:GNAT superfamily N-acetyltransferase
MDEFKVERWNRAKHQRDDFCCGKPPLDDFLRSLPSQYEKRKIGTTYVLVKTGDPRVMGYYTLASGSVPFESLPAKIAKKLPMHPLPVVLLARLAVDQSVRGRGLGSQLLFDALHRVYDLSKNLGIYAVEVDAIDTEAQAFYRKFGFQSFLDKPLHLYLPIATIEKLSSHGK